MKIISERNLIFDKGWNAGDIVNCNIQDAQKDLISQNGGLVVGYRFKT